MFSKRTTKLPEITEAEIAAVGLGAEAPRTKLRAASLLCADLTVEGNVTSDGEVQIDGTVRGDVRVSRLTIGETGHVEGQVFCDTVEVRGRVIGSLTAKQVRLYGAAYVDGDVTHEQLSIEAGAFFQGRSLKFQRPAPALEVVTVSEEPAAAKAV